MQNNETDTRPLGDWEDNETIKSLRKHAQEQDAALRESVARILGATGGSPVSVEWAYRVLEPHPPKEPDIDQALRDLFREPWYKRLWSWLRGTK